MHRLSGAFKRRTPLRISEPILLEDTALAWPPSPVARRSRLPTRTLKVSDTPVLDYYTHADIIDEILYYLPFTDLLQWRMTSRELHAKLDFLRLSLHIRPTSHPADDWCVMEVRTGGSVEGVTTGGVLLGGWSCRYRPPAGVLYTDTRRPKLRAARACKLVRQVDIRGCCPHGSPIPAAFIQEVEAERVQFDGARIRTSTRLLSPPVSRPGSSQAFATRGHLRVDLFPDEHGDYAAGLPLTKLSRTVTLHENWRARSKMRVSRPGDVPRYVFVIDGTEPNSVLVRSSVPSNACVMYDFSVWREGLDQEWRFGNTTRLSSLVAHAANVLASGGKVYFLGLHLIDPYWLDPAYPDEEDIPTPDHPDWHPLAVHVCGSIIAQLNATHGGVTSTTANRIQLLPRSTTLVEWADFARPMDPKLQIAYPHFYSDLDSR